MPSRSTGTGMKLGGVHTDIEVPDADDGWSLMGCLKRHPASARTAATRKSAAKRRCFSLGPRPNGNKGAAWPHRHSTEPEGLT